MFCAVFLIIMNFRADFKLFYGITFTSDEKNIISDLYTKLNLGNQCFYLPNSPKRCDIYRQMYSFTNKMKSTKAVAVLKTLASVVTELRKETRITNKINRSGVITR